MKLLKEQVPALMSAPSGSVHNPRRYIFARGRLRGYPPGEAGIEIGRLAPEKVCRVQKNSEMLNSFRFCCELQMYRQIAQTAHAIALKRFQHGLLLRA